MAKSFPVTRIKTHRVYTPWEAANALGVVRVLVTVRLRAKVTRAISHALDTRVKRRSKAE